MVRRINANSLGLGGEGGQPRQQELQFLRLPPPMSGVNLRDPIEGMSPSFCIRGENLLPDKYGLRIRPGYQDWITTIDSSTGTVRTLISFEGESSADDELWAATINGLIVATSSTASPSYAFSWGIQSGDAGFCNYYSYTNDNGDKFLMLCDEQNGLHYYNPATSTWAVAADITGVAEADLVWIAEHKNRLWFVERNTADAWYLATGTKGGTATKFSLGNKFPHGGSLHSIYNWSVDGGDGVDDLLVFISTSGDVAVYQGTDVASAATWQSLGTWYIGRMPQSRKVATNIGGQLNILTSYGLLALQDLIQGVSIEQAVGQRSFARNIASALREDMSPDVNSLYGSRVWDLVSLPSLGAFAIARPYSSLGNALMYVFSLTQPSWWFWKEVPAVSLVEFKGEVYCGGTGDGKVHKIRGIKDAANSSGNGGAGIDFYIQYPYLEIGVPGSYAKIEMIQPSIIGDDSTANLLEALANFNYDDTKIIDANANFSATGVFSPHIPFAVQGMGLRASPIVRGRTFNLCRYFGAGVWWRQASHIGLPSSS